MSKLDLKIKGVRGGVANWQPNKGSVTAFIDKGNYIHVDAFEGEGNEYKRRGECYIEINIGSTYWSGYADDLCKILNNI